MEPDRCFSKRIPTTKESIEETRERVVQELAYTRELIMQEFAAFREHRDAQHAEKMAVLQRLTDGSLPHIHEADGSITFLVPPPAAPPEDQEP